MGDSHPSIWMQRVDHNELDRHCFCRGNSVSHRHCTCRCNCCKPPPAIRQATPQLDSWLEESHTASPSAARTRALASWTRASGERARERLKRYHIGNNYVLPKSKAANRVVPLRPGLRDTGIQTAINTYFYHDYPELTGGIMATSSYS
jgi:hypothetical protein